MCLTLGFGRASGRNCPLATVYDKGNRILRSLCSKNFLEFRWFRGYKAMKGSIIHAEPFCHHRPKYCGLYASLGGSQLRHAPQCAPGDPQELRPTPSVRNQPHRGGGLVHGVPLRQHLPPGPDLAHGQRCGGRPWNTDQPIPSRPDGYPLEVPFSSPEGPQVVHTLLFTDQNGGYIRGDYRLIVDGQGEILINGGHQGTYQAPTDQIIALEGQIGIRINRSEAEDPLRNIRIIHPDHTGSFLPGGDNPFFTDDFLAFVEDFDLIRFMDWTGTNNSTEELWANRVPADQYTMFGRVAWEQVIELANTAQKDPWICVPHRADDLYVRELARLFRENLDPELTLYLEYSNEVWNAIFEQNAYAAEAAAARGFTGEPWVRSWTWTALRSAEIFTIFEQEFGGSSRLLKILPTQSGKPLAGGRAFAADGGS
jgi:hypothetical protein